MPTKAELEASLKREHLEFRTLREKYYEVLNKYNEMSKVLEEGILNTNRDSYSIKNILSNFFETVKYSYYYRPTILSAEQVKTAHARKRAHKNAFLTTLLETCAVVYHERDQALMALEALEKKIENLNKEINEKNELLEEKGNVVRVLEDIQILINKIIPLQDIADEPIDVFNLRRSIEDMIEIYGE